MGPFDDPPSRKIFGQEKKDAERHLAEALRHHRGPLNKESKTVSISKDKFSDLE